MRVEQLMTKQVQWCRPDDSLERVAQLMWDHDCGSLPVCSDDGATRAVGMITDRDIAMCAMFHPRSLRELPVSEAMSRSLRVGHPGDSVVDAEKTMRVSQIRRLPIVDDGGRLLGMLSLADLARNAVLESPAGAAAITETEVGDTLAAICASSHRRLAAA